MTHLAEPPPTRPISDSPNVIHVLQWLREYAQRHGIEEHSRAHAALAAFGIFGLEVPPIHGGLGLSRADAMHVMEQLGAIDLALATSVIIHYNVTQALTRYASEAQKQGLLTRIVSGHLRAAFSLTEPDSGSHLWGIKCHAEPTDGGYHLHGEKAWCGGAGAADIVLVLARMGRDGPLTTFLVDRTAPGFTVHPPHPLIGVTALGVHDISLRRVFVPHDRLLGAVGQGFQVVESALSAARMGIAAISLGASKRALQWAVRFGSRRQLAHGPLLEHPVVRATVAELLHAEAAVDALVYRSCAAIDGGQPAPLAVALACKVAATEWLGVTADRLVQWMGARGYHAHYPAGRLYCDYRLFRIGEGPSEALTEHIGALQATNPQDLCAFVAESLGAPDVADFLAALNPAPGSDRETFHSALGKAVIEALCWAAARDDREVAAWCAARSRKAAHDLLAHVAAPPVGPLRARVDAFDRRIGALSQTVPNAHRIADPYLSDAGVAPSRSTISPAELAILERWESGGPPPRGVALIHPMVDAVAAATPLAPAVFSDDEVLGYAELVARAERLAGALQSAGVTPGTLVPVYLRRTSRMIVAALGVLKAGGIFVPLDPVSPPERLQRLMHGLDHTVMLTEGPLRERVTAYRLLDVDALPTAAFTPVDLPLAAPALIIHTSGSTGQPKPVVLTHEGFATMLLCRQALSPLDGSDRVLQCATPTFDISFWEYFAPLIAGACLVTPAHARSEWDGAEVAARIRSLQITTLQTVPTLLGDLLAHTRPGDLASLRRIYCGGEPLTRELAMRCARMTDAMFVNVYGPTEVTVECTWYVYSALDDGNLPPIGRPTPGRKLYLLDGSRQRVPPGTPGEIYIGGVALARGYLHDDDATARLFVPDPFSAAPNARMYKSGDLGRHRTDGNIEFLGRIDRQVKIRGVRIELGEVEHALLEHPAVVQVVACAVERGDDGKVLVAYVCARPDAPLDEAALYAHAARTLPRALLPAALVVLPRLPMTSTGKVDIQALPPVDWSPSPRALEFAANPTERAVLEILTHALGVTKVGLDDDFFSLGGHSLTGTRIIAAVRERFGCKIRLNDFFANGTARWLALAVDSAATPAAGDSHEVSISLHDTTRAREVPMLIYLPEGGGRHPVVLFSHGLGGTREGYAYLGRHWAKQGYVAVHVQHEGSDIEVLLQARNPMLSAMQASSDRRHLMHRPLDLSFALSQLERLQASHPALKDRLDLERVGAAGHSFGAFTALAMAGLEITLDDGERHQFADPRIKAVVALSPPALFGGALDLHSYHHITRPCMHMSGTRDDGPVFRITPDERRFS